jgi:lipopolysaccharide export system permease protein
VIKKLDLLILRAFIGPFIATFLISLFVLIMQFFWLYIDDLVGKGLDFNTLVYLIGVVAITWVPLALPLALLISSIMTFGNLGETFEIVAIKSAGIPLLRFMRPLLIFTVFISGFAFLCANNIIPVAQLKFETLKHDIILKKPAFDIKEGVFYNKIDGYVLKIGKKEKDDSTIRNIVIYEKNSALQDNILVAESGIMRVTANSKFLEFVLKNGWRYQEKGMRYAHNTEFIRMGFKEYKKVFDLRSFTMNNSKEDAFKYDPKMLSIRQLNFTIDSLNKYTTIGNKRLDTDIKLNLAFTKISDSAWNHFDKFSPKKKVVVKKVSDSLNRAISNQIIAKVRTVATSLNETVEEKKMKSKSLSLHWIEWHRKFTLSVACIVLFLIGAPLGSIIRKGGLGTPLVFAIIFFVIFHLLNTFGEKFSKEAVLSPAAGMWLSTIVLIPIGAFLTYKAMKDSQLFNQEAYYRFFNSVKKLVSRKPSNNHQI